MMYNRASLFAAVSALALITAAPLSHAQSTLEDDPGFLERMIQNALGGDGRDVQIRGLEGPLSSEPHISEIVVADADGQWLMIRDVALNWSRLALFRGRVEINALTVGEIALDRPPLPAPKERGSLEAKPKDNPTDEDQENTGFALPELPVSLRLDELAINAIRLGQPVLGQPAELSLEGKAKLEGGEGDVDLRLVRLEGPAGEFDLSAGFDNETRQLRTDLDFREDRGGLISTLANIPGAPPLELTIKGDDPISDFTAAIALLSDGQDRLGGNVRLSETPLTGEDGTDLVQQSIEAALSGDVTALFAPDYQAFFGNELKLDLRANRQADLGLDVEHFDLSAAAMQITGSMGFDPGFAPQMLDLSGTLGQSLDLPVTLPLPGPNTALSRAVFDLDFDASKGEAFTFDLSADNITREGTFLLDQLVLDGDGKLIADEENPISAVTALITGEISGLSMDDPRLFEAAGDAAALGARLDWSRAGTMELSDLRVTSGDLALTGAAQATGLSGDEPKLTLQADFDSGPLHRFATVTGTELTGQMDARLSAGFEPATGAFALSLDGDGQNLAIGHPNADVLLQGPLDLELVASRGAEGINIETLALENDNLTLTGGGRLATEQGDLILTGGIGDLAIFGIEDLDGPVDLNVSLKGEDDLWDALFDLHSDRSRINGSGEIENLLDGALRIRAGADIQTGDIGLYAPLAGLPLAGDLTLSAKGSFDAESGDASLLANGDANDLRIGQAQLDGLLKGKTQLDVNAERSAERITIERLLLDNAALQLAGQGHINGKDGDLRLSAAMPDIGALQIENLTGPVDLDASLKGESDQWQGKLDLVSNETTLTGNARIADLVAGQIDATGSFNLKAEDLRRYADLAGMPLTGALSINADGAFNAETGDGALKANGDGRGISTGIAQLDEILAGGITLNVDADRSDGDIALNQAQLRSDQLNLTANGDMINGAGSYDLNLALADLGRLVEGVSGPLNLTGTLEGESDKWDLASNLTGPAGMQATINGGAIRPGGEVDLAIKGGLPLILANAFISPRSVIGDLGFDLGLKGKPGLEALGGTVTINNARAADPSAKLVLEDINPDLDMANQSANINLTGNVATGGRISVSGPVELTPPFNANITTALQSVTLLDPALYELNLNGDASIRGALATNAAINAAIVIERADIKIPSGLGGPGAISDVSHIGEPAESRETRARAGIKVDAEEGTDAGSGSGPAYPLNVVIAAPRQIFVRGRGLDIEMGGGIQVRGTTANPVPTGGIEILRGQMALLGQRLEFDRAKINMRGDLVPSLDIAAYSDSGSVRSQILISGPVTAPEIAFASEPELPEDEVLAQLFFGKPINELTPFEVAQLLGSVNRLTGGGEGILGGLRGGVGLDNLGVSTSEDGGTEVTAGKYITERLYTDVTVGSGGTSQIELNYDVNSTLKGRVGFDSEGNSSVGFAFERDY